MNKLQNHRYFFNKDPFNSNNSELKLKSINKTQALSMLAQKQSQISIVKRRISALCIKEAKVTNKTINNELQLSKRNHIKNQSMQIKSLLQKQRKIDQQKLQQIKNRNLQSRVDTYYKSKNIKEIQLQQKRQRSSMIKTKSKQNISIINQNKQTLMKERYKKCRSIYELEKTAKLQRALLGQQKNKSISSVLHRETEHLLKLGDIKGHQLNQLEKLELLMVERNNSSKMAYQASVDRLRNNSSKSSKRSTNFFSSVNKSSSARKQVLNNVSPIKFD